MNLSKFLNLTPHEIAVHVAGVPHRIPPSGLTARVEAVDRPADDIEGIPSVRRELGSIHLPFQAEEHVERGGWLVVSALALEALRSQMGPIALSAIAPDTGPTAIRDQGRIVAVTRFVRA